MTDETDSREHSVTDRVELINPEDRVRGTVVNLTEGGYFTVKYDNGDYVGYNPEDHVLFAEINNKPIPPAATDLIRILRQRWGRTPPETSIPTQMPRTNIPNTAEALTPPPGETSIDA